MQSFHFEADPPLLKVSIPLIAPALPRVPPPMSYHSAGRPKTANAPSKTSPEPPSNRVRHNDTHDTRFPPATIVAPTTINTQMIRPIVGNYGFRSRDSGGRVRSCAVRAPDRPRTSPGSPREYPALAACHCCFWGRRSCPWGPGVARGSQGLSMDVQGCLKL